MVARMEEWWEEGWQRGTNLFLFSWEISIAINFGNSANRMREVNTWDRGNNWRINVTIMEKIGEDKNKMKGRGSDQKDHLFFWVWREWFDGRCHKFIDVGAGNFVISFSLYLIWRKKRYYIQNGRQKDRLKRFPLRFIISLIFTLNIFIE